MKVQVELELVLGSSTKENTCKIVKMSKVLKLSGSNSNTRGNVLMPFNGPMLLHNPHLL